MSKQVKVKITAGADVPANLTVTNNASPVQSFSATKAELTSDNGRTFTMADNATTVTVSGGIPCNTSDTEVISQGGVP
jgi:hypothetical protein